MAHFIFCYAFAWQKQNLLKGSESFEAVKEFFTKKVIFRRGNPFFLPPAAYFSHQREKYAKAPPKPMVLESFALYKRAF